LEALKISLPARLWRGVRCWFIKSFFGSEPALLAVSSLVFGLVGGHCLAATYWPEPVGYTLCCAGAALVGLAGLRLASWLLFRLIDRRLTWLLSLALLAGCMAWLVKLGAGEGWSWRVILFSAVSALILWTLAGSWWSLLVRRVRSFTTVLVALLSAVGVLLLGVFLFTDGFDDHYLARYLALSSQEQSVRPSLKESLGPGSWQVAAVDYGPGEEIPAETVDLSDYMSREGEAFTEHYVEAYWDYDLTAVPMRGRVWYPVGAQGCPVLFMAHGNHKIATESYLGYAYLGEYLASHGYVVVSVDQNACNMLSGENDGRAVLLLRHIDLLLEYSSTQGNPLYGLLDEENIAIAGHSRGGEMVATAYLFNQYDRYPENGTIGFDFNFSIKSIVAIAPTVDQYKPADHSVRLKDVNYLLLHGAADRDVTGFMGMTQYENISFTGERPCLKTALYIAGANHGQFNSLWGEYDEAGPFAALLNPESLISQADQQQIVCLFTKVFLDVTLRGDTANVELLTDWDDFAGQLPDTVYAQCYETSGFMPIADFEEDSDLETATLGGVTTRAYDCWLWTEELMNFSGGSSSDTHALRLCWSDTGQYTLFLPPLDISGKSLVFDICDLDSDSVEAGEYSLVDAVVTVRDRHGNRGQAQLRDFAAVYPIWPVRTDKLDYLFDTCTYKKAFSTVSIPASSFRELDAAMDWTRIRRIDIAFSVPGEVAIDNIGLESPITYMETN